MDPSAANVSSPDSGDSNTRLVRRIGGQDIVFDGEGFFWDPRDWSKERAEILARESGLDTLTDLHWRTLLFLREYYFSNGRAPMNRHLKSGLGMNLLALEGLFPGGIRNGARRLAGLPNPKGCNHI